VPKGFLFSRGFLLNYDGGEEADLLHTYMLKYQHSLLRPIPVVIFSLLELEVSIEREWYYYNYGF
jgi:hypothetical protein